MSRLRKFTTLTIGLTLALITLGGVVRATGAGLACPDWPLCHGRLIPPLQGLILIEYSHRLVASVVGLVTLLLLVTIWRRHRQEAALVRWGFLAGVLLAAQIILGGLTVRTELTAGLVAAHLGTAVVFLTTLLLLYTAAWRREFGALPAPAGLRLAAPLAAVVAFMQIVLGGYVSGSGAALACPDFPLCRGALIPPLAGPILIHFLHRLGALAVALGVIVLGVQARGSSGLLRRLIWAAAVLLVAQITLGALNIYTRVAPPVTVLHLFTAVALFGTLGLLAGLTALPQAAPSRGLRQTAGDYLALTKPRIVMLLLATTATTMMVAAGRHLSWALLGYTMLGGALAARPTRSICTGTATWTR